MNFMKLVFFLTLSIIGLSSFAQPNVDLVCADKKLESLPVQASGRVKPLRVHAYESLKYIMGKNKTDMSDTQLFCRLSMKAFMGVKQKLPILVEHIETRKLVGLLDENQKTMPLSNLEDSATTLEFEYNKTKEDQSSFHKDLSKTLGRLNLAKAIVEGQSWSFYDKALKTWIPFQAYLTENKLNAHGSRTGIQGYKLIKDYLLSSQDAYNNDHGDDYMLEFTYSKLHLFSWCMLVVLGAIILLTVLKSSTLGLTTAWLAIIIQLIGMTIRVMISGRAPITNMYETVMFSGFGALLIGLITTHVKKDNLYVYGGLAYNMLCLLMLTFANSMLDSSISPLVPVLRDNFWLSTHVTCIILSYAALALSWMVANIVLIQNVFSKLSHKDYKQKEGIVYNCIKIGTVLLSAGIILGGVWADYSWGRFWGWDPKETWSLIVLLIYTAILHGRFSAWIPKERFVLLTAGAFMSVMMAWFGVNYILASGLHSYGFSEGGAIFLGSFFVVQIALLLVTYRKPLPLRA